MALTYSSEMLGTLTIKQNNRNFKIDIRRGNCLEEWSADNDMPEEWWCNETDEDEIFFKL